MELDLPMYKEAYRNIATSIKELEMPNNKEEIKKLEEVIERNQTAIHAWKKGTYDPSIWLSEELFEENDKKMFEEYAEPYNANIIEAQKMISELENGMEENQTQLKSNKAKQKELKGYADNARKNAEADYKKARAAVVEEWEKSEEKKKYDSNMETIQIINSRRPNLMKAEEEALIRLNGENIKLQQVLGGKLKALEDEYNQFLSDLDEIDREFGLDQLDKEVVEEKVAEEKPEPKQPAQEQPATQKPEPKQPDQVQPAIQKPEPKQPAQEQPAAQKPEPKQPAQEQPAAQKPEPKQPAQEQPAAQKTEPKQPAQEQPTAQKPEQKTTKPLEENNIAMAIKEMRALGLSDDQIKSHFFPRDAGMTTPIELMGQVGEILSKYGLYKTIEEGLRLKGNDKDGDKYRQYIENIKDSFEQSRQEEQPSEQSNAQPNVEKATEKKEKGLEEPEEKKKLEKITIYISRYGSRTQIDREKSVGEKATIPDSTKRLTLTNKDGLKDISKNTTSGDKYVRREILRAISEGKLSQDEGEEQLNLYTKILESKSEAERKALKKDLKLNLRYNLKRMRKSGLAKEERKEIELNAKQARDLGIGEVEAPLYMKAKWAVQEFNEKHVIKTWLTNAKNKAKNLLPKRKKPEELEAGKGEPAVAQTAKKPGELSAEERKNQQEYAKTRAEAEKETQQPAAEVDSKMSDIITSQIEKSGDR